MDRLQQIKQSWKSGQISDAQMALNFFVITHLEKYPRRSLAQYLNHYFEDQLFIPLDTDVLERFQFKKIKEKALTCLQHWVKGDWPLVLQESIPSALQVLRLQAQGLRPVTMKIEKRFESILHREDALDFFCHDLEHGHMFFYDDELNLSQQRFFQKILESLDLGVWDQYLRNPEFEKKFVYLISDMNSHPEHYRAYLNSMIEPEKVGSFDYLFT